MTDKEKLERSLDEIQDAIGYMERRMARTAVNKVTDMVLLRLCNAVKLLLESKIREDNFFTVCDQILTPPPRTKEEEKEAQRQQLIYIDEWAFTEMKKEEDNDRQSAD